MKRCGGKWHPHSCASLSLQSLNIDGREDGLPHAPPHTWGSGRIEGGANAGGLHPAPCAGTGTRLHMRMFMHTHEALQQAWVLSPHFPSASAPILAWVQPTAGCQGRVAGRPHRHSVIWTCFGYEQPSSWYPCSAPSRAATIPCPRDLGGGLPLPPQRLQIPKTGLSLTEGTTLPTPLPLPSHVSLTSSSTLEEQTLM